MQLTPYTELKWAYQLHYYLCFQAHRRRSLFRSDERITLLQSALREICGQHDYHLLQFKTYPDHLRCLVSLRPNQPIATAIQKIKANLSRVYGAKFAVAPPLWARGYLARSTGRVRIESVKRYLENQATHHGYDKRVRPPIFRYRARAVRPLTAAHAVFDLTHHLVFATRYRRGVFDAAIGAALAAYWLNVAIKHGFAIEQMSIVPDHTHLIVKTVPKISIESCALALLNNGQHFVGKRFPQALVQAGIEGLWQPSGYAGTCGQMTTALVKSFLSRKE